MASAEAGPSKASTPPTTPTSAKLRRRSWFSLGSPAFSNSSPTRKDKSDSRRSSVADEEVELAPVILESPAGPSRITVQDTDGTEELLTIDGDPEKTVMKKKRRSQDAFTGEVLRMEDLAGKSPTRKVSESSMTSLTPDPGGTTNSLPPRRSSRMASDRNPFPNTPPLPPDKDDEDDEYDFMPPSATPRLVFPTPQLSSTAIPRRNSSIPPGFSSPTIQTSPDQKSQPPTPQERPLPALPPIHTAETPPPSMPRSIVVTPSSPQRPLYNARSSSALAVLVSNEERGRSRASSRSRSSSRTPRKANGILSSPIGLGLPTGSPRTSPLDEQPPPLPAKSQSVSSPLPSRTSSPAPKIAFTEPEGKESRIKDGATVPVDEKKRRVKRARSLSGIFNRTPIEPEKPNGKDPKEAEAKEVSPAPPVEVTSTKASGVLGWLGVRKTVKRRQSESRLNKDGTPEDGGSSPVTPETSEAASTKEKVKSRESLGLDAELRESEQYRRRPELRSESSGVTVMPQASQSKLSSLFSRRASSKGPVNTTDVSPAPPPLPDALIESSTPLPPALAQPIPISSSRNLTATSSQSSLTLPSSDATFSPALPQEELSSPASEAEEMLSSGAGALWAPGMRPWIDSALSAHSSNRSSVSSPLGSMPEQGVLDTIQAPRVVASKRQGRVRSWSDAPLPQPSRAALSSNPHLPVGSADSSTSLSLQPSPLTPTRPKLEGRTSSGNSAVVGKMRTIFKKSNSRTRGNPLLRQQSSDVEEFGSLHSDDWPQGVKMEPSLSSSSDVPPSATNQDLPHVSLLGLDGDRQIFHQDGPIRSTRSSTAASLTSVASGESSRAEVRREPTVRANRPRASTMSNGPSVYAFAPPPSPGLFPVAVTPPRRRPSVIQRISNGKFGSGPPSPKGPSPLFPLPSRSSRPTSPGAVSTADDVSGVVSLDSSPRPSTGSIAVVSESDAVKRAKQREGNETPEEWLNRITPAISRSEISDVLASNPDEFLTEALRLYMNRFDFTHNPLDVALRKLLMQISLPGETQQIDRIMEAFAVRYEQCEPNLFVQKAAALDARQTSGRTTPTFAGSIASTRSSKIDVYNMIVNDLLSSLRVDVEQHIPAQDPFSALGTRPILNVEALHRSFAQAHSIQITAPPRRKNSGASLLSSAPTKTASTDPEMSLRVTKVGLLSRKDDVSDIGKKATRKWRSWSVILTGSQLLFFKDPSWALTLLDQARSSDATEAGRQLLPKMSIFKPDEVFPIKDCVAVFDREYHEYLNTFLFVMPRGRQYLLQASDEFEMNEWITLVNYGSTFKTAELRMRASGMKKDQAVLAGAAAAASHQRDIRDSVASTDSTNGRKAFGEPSGDLSSSTPPQPTVLEVGSTKTLVDVEGADGTGANEGEQLEEVFDEVKAELLASRSGATKSGPVAVTNGHSEEDVLKTPAHAARSATIQDRISAFTAKAQSIAEQLIDHLRVARNLAILSPFQKTSRDRIIAAIPPLSEQIRQCRLDLARLHVYATVLRQDHEREEREWASIRHVALQAASKSLRDSKGIRAVVEDVNGNHSPPIPSLSLPSQDEFTEDLPQLGSSHEELPVMFRRSSGEVVQRPTISRHVSASSFTNHSPTGQSPLRRSSSDLLARHQSGSPITSPEERGYSTGGHSTPMMVALSDVDEEGGRVRSVGQHIETRENATAVIDLAEGIEEEYPS